MMKPGLMCITQTGAVPGMALHSTLSDWTLGNAYPASQGFTPVGGTAPYTFAVSTGSLPTGMSLDTSTGAVTGTPTVGGTYNFTVTVTDSTSGTPLTASKAGTINVLTDANFANVVALLHYEGNDGDTTTVDSSGHAFAVSAVGAPLLKTTQKKFGNTSCFVGTTQNNGWSIPNNAAFNALGTQDWTIEFWAYPTAWPPGGNNEMCLGVAFWETSPFIWNVTYNGNNGLTFYYNNTFPFFATGLLSGLLNGWHHFAYVRHSGLITLYIDGIKTGTPISIGSTSISTNTTAHLTFGVQISGGSGINGFKGYLDDTRFTIGTARYTANFTPPTMPFPNG